jgi:hypothetical protein
MSTETELKLARYNETIKEVDSWGRIIGVRRLRPSEQTKVSGMTAELSGSDEVTGPDGAAIHIPHRMPLLIAAAVCNIGEDYIPFPRNRAELDAIYDRLDVEGLSAAGKAFARLQGVEPVNPLEAAKN